MVKLNIEQFVSNKWENMQCKHESMCSDIILIEYSTHRKVWI